MKPVQRWLFVVALLAAACQQQSSEADSVVTVSEPGTVAPAAIPETPWRSTGVPQAMQGRWGMSANDCDPRRSDNKGLMVIGSDTLRFYESRAVLQNTHASAIDEFRARFTFAGEGMEWETVETLTLRDNGAVLVRRSEGPDGAFGPFEYRRCA